jgi:serine-type D-Ala-D-Ala carboxypeptidase/endopeptidase
MRFSCLGLACCVLYVAVATAQTPPIAATPTDAEIRRILMERIDVRKQSVGIVVGVIDSTGRRVIAYGNLEKGDKRRLDGDTIFEIGSITKVFTALLAADMAQRREVKLDDPIAKYLPASVKIPERNGCQITLVDLATHTSGLPRMPANFRPKDPAQRAGLDYEKLVVTRICDPLGMKSTRSTLSEPMRQRLAAGHSSDLVTVSGWDIPTLAGAGALRSSANDLLAFLAAMMGYTDSPLAAVQKTALSVSRPSGEPFMRRRSIDMSATTSCPRISS